jgi:hypothetical protein
MTSSEAPALLHIVGYLTGASLYAMLLVMGIGSRGSGRRPIIGTAALGLIWNLGELATHALQGAGLALAAAWTAAGSFGALSFLAAVAVHAAGRGPGAEPPDAAAPVGRITGGAYICAAVATLMQLYAAASSRPLPWFPALLVMTAGLTVLAVALLASARRQPNSRRVVWIATLALVAVSALHLGNWHGESEGLATELAGHQASIPLALAILYQDYRFGFVDLFLKRALSFLAAVAVAYAGWSFAQITGDLASFPAAGVLLALWVTSALMFPWLKRRISTFVDRVILRRSDYATVAETLSGAIQACASEDDVLVHTCRTISDALDATPVTWRTTDGTVAEAHEVAIPTADGPCRVIAVGPLHGGRRLLSDDCVMLDGAAQIAGRRIDAIRLSEERHGHELREREIQMLASESELRALRAQINPHFLFNALTTIGYLIQHAPARALSTLLRLTTLLRAVLKSEGEFTTLGQECHLIECYLEIERERFEERLDTTLDIPDSLARTTIPALIVQPLVENAIKHGIAGARDGGRVAVSAALTPDGRRLQVVVSNTGMPLSSVGSPDGIGLQNVERRLRCYYGDRATFVLRSDPSGQTRAELTLPLDAVRAGIPAMERAS